MAMPCSGPSPRAGPCRRLTPAASTLTLSFSTRSTPSSDGSLANAINNGVVGFTAANHFGNTSSILFAFNNGDGTTIADVQFHNANTNTAVHVDHVQDLVDLVGVTTTALQPANIHFS